MTLYEDVPLAHAELAPGWMLIQVNFDPYRKLGQKTGAGALSGWALFCKTTVYVNGELQNDPYVLECSDMCVSLV